MNNVVIEGFGALSAAGIDTVRGNGSPVQEECGRWSYRLNAEATSCLESYELDNRQDKVIRLARVAANRAVVNAGWTPDAAVGVAAGTARGAVDTLASHMHLFFNGERVPTASSPQTTAGLVSGEVAKDLLRSGHEVRSAFTIGATCTSSLAAICNGYAWLRARLCDRSVCGGSEAPLVSFTFAQFEALGITWLEKESPVNLPYPAPRNSMVLGEGAAFLALGRGRMGDDRPKLAAIGVSHELPGGAAAIKGEALLQAMRSARASVDEIDAIVVHGPGTVRGDAVELAACKQLFGPKLPEIHRCQRAIGHTLGASGTFGIVYGIELLNAGAKAVMINGAGFGGAAYSVVITAGSTPVNLL